MEKIKMEEIEKKVAELKIKHGVTVHALVFTGENEEDTVIGFMKEPPRAVKLRVLDKGLVSPMTAASELVDAYLIREESDERIYSDKEENDSYYIGATMEAYKLVQMRVNQFKKK